MKEDRSIPLILGKPFLAISSILIDVPEDKLIMRVGNEQVKFNSATR